MKRVLLDTNVVLDVLLRRAPHYAASAAVWSAVETRQTEGLLSGHAIATIFYLIRKESGSANARRIIASILQVFRVAAVDESVIKEALRVDAPDFEDSIVAAAAFLADCDYIVTRDPRGFRKSRVRPLGPEAVIPILCGA